MSKSSYEGFYGAKLVNRFVLLSIRDDPFFQKMPTPNAKRFGTNVMFFIQANFLVTYKQRCFKEDVFAYEHGIELQKPFEEIAYSDFLKVLPEHKMEMLYIVGRCLQLEKEGNKIEDLVKNTEAWRYFINCQDSIIPNGWIAKGFSLDKA